MAVAKDLSVFTRYDSAIVKPPVLSDGDVLTKQSS